jgi:hypothetical protein
MTIPTGRTMAKIMRKYLLYASKALVKTILSPFPYTPTRLTTIIWN